MLEYLFAKFGKWAAILGAILMAVLYAFTRGRSEGKAVATKQITSDINKQANKVDDALRKVDNSPIDFDAAVSRLRKRGGTKK